HRLAEVADHDLPHPLVVLHVDGLAEPVLDPESLRFFLADDAPCRRHLRDVGRDVVAGRELDDHERQGGDRPDGEDGEQDAAADVREHRRVLPLPPQFFQKNVAGREIPGVLPSGLLYMREGMLPMLFFTTRTPIEAGPWPTTPMM